MIRIIIGFIALLGIIASLAWLADHPGTVEMTFEGTTITSSFVALMVAILLFSILCCVLFWALLWLRLNAPMIGKNRQAKRVAKGIAELTQAEIAASEKDYTGAKKHLSRAALYIADEPLLLTLGAKVSEELGDHDAALTYYKKMQANPICRSLGLRGHAHTLRRAGDISQALKIARLALSDNAKSGWANEQVFAMEVTLNNWTEAKNALNGATKTGGFDSATAKKHRAALTYAESLEQAASGDSDAAMVSLKTALKDDPGLVPAAMRYAKLLTEDGHPNRATRALKAAWKSNPHPNLIKTLFALHPTASAIDMNALLEGMVVDNADHPDVLYAKAKIAVEADKIAEAKEQLTTILKSYDSRKAWALLTEVQQRSGLDSHTAQEAMIHATDPLWACNNCNDENGDWTPICTECGRFNSMEWQAYTPVGETNKHTKSAPMTLVEDTIKPPAPAEG